MFYTLNFNGKFGLLVCSWHQIFNSEKTSNQEIYILTFFFLPQFNSWHDYNWNKNNPKSLFCCHTVCAVIPEHYVGLFSINPSPAAPRAPASTYVYRSTMT